MLIENVCKPGDVGVSSYPKSGDCGIKESCKSRPCGGLISYRPWRGGRGAAFCWNNPELVPPPGDRGRTYVPPLPGCWAAARTCLDPSSGWAEYPGTSPRPPGGQIEHYIP